MLLYAELVYDTKPNVAKDLLNAIHSRATGKNVAIEVIKLTDPTFNLLQAIKDERQMELFGEGVELFDEIRRGEWLQNAKDKYEAMADTYDTGSAAAYKVIANRVTQNMILFPIPQVQMKAVSAGTYKQNEGY